MPAKRLRQLNAAMDERLGSQHFLKKALDHVFPDNWSFMLGELAMYSFIILIGTGVFLTFFFNPSDRIVTYTGPYVPLHGQSVTEAYQSVLQISFDVKAGLLFRQMHHWAADIFVAAITVHLLRIFFTGAFRKPRDINWMVGLTMLILTIVNGYMGYSMLDDLISGMGLRIGYSLALSIPVVGNYVAYLFFGGQYPSDQLTHRLFIMHVLIVPAVIATLLALHLALIWHQKHTQFPGRGRSQKKVVGSQLWPTYTARSIGLFCATIGAIALLGGLAQIEPVWLYGPYQPYAASSFAEPDWYVGWLIGALRLFPGWRLHIFGYTVSEIFWPGVFFPLLFFGIMYAYPFFERWWTGDLFNHNLLERPRDRPGRTAFGVGTITFLLMLEVAGSQDVLADLMQISQPPLTLTLRGMAIFAPVLAAGVTWRVCRDLSGARLPETEPPEAPAAEGATPPAERYLPDRVRYEAAGDGAGPRPRAGRLIRGAGAAASGAAAGFVMGRLRDSRARSRAGRRR